MVIGGLVGFHRHRISLIRTIYMDRCFIGHNCSNGIILRGYSKNSNILNYHGKRTNRRLCSFGTNDVGYIYCIYYVRSTQFNIPKSVLNRSDSPAHRMEYQRPILSDLYVKDAIKTPIIDCQRTCPLMILFKL